MSDKVQKEREDSFVCEIAKWIGKKGDLEKARETYLETVEENGCFSF